MILVGSFLSALVSDLNQTVMMRRGSSRGGLTASSLMLLAACSKVRVLNLVTSKVMKIFGKGSKGQSFCTTSFNPGRWQYNMKLRALTPSDRAATFLGWLSLQPVRPCLKEGQAWRPKLPSQDLLHLSLQLVLHSRG